jgi:hypothetical protein
MRRTRPRAAGKEYVPLPPAFSARFAEAANPFTRSPQLAGENGACTAYGTHQGHRPGCDVALPPFRQFQVSERRIVSGV